MKNTKRSMLITTVLMVVVLVVAISTSTFAWYTASSSGSATSAEITSAQSSSANIAVGWTNTATTSTIAFYNTPGTTVAPMCPTEALATKTGTPAFYTNDLSAGGVFNNNRTNANPWTVQNAEIDNGEGVPATPAGEFTSFYVVNNNVNAAATVNMTMTATHANETVKGLLKVAVYARQADADTTHEEAAWTCLGVLGGTYVYGDPANGVDPDTLGTGEGVASIALSLAKNGEAGGFVEIKVYAWLDGTGLVQTYAGQTVGFSFGFGV